MYFLLLHINCESPTEYQLGRVLTPVKGSGHRNSINICQKYNVGWRKTAKGNGAAQGDSVKEQIQRSELFHRFAWTFYMMLTRINKFVFLNFLPL